MQEETLSSRQCPRGTDHSSLHASAPCVSFAMLGGPFTLPRMPDANCGFACLGMPLRHCHASQGHLVPRSGSGCSAQAPQLGMLAYQ